MQRPGSDGAREQSTTPWANMKTFLKTHLPRNLVLEVQKRRYAKVIRSGMREKEFDVIKYLVSPGDSVADLGANMGIYSVFLSGLVGRTGRVYSVEPIRYTYTILQYVVRTLDLTNVKTFECAVSDREGTQTMLLPAYETGELNLYEAKIAESDSSPGQRRESVETRMVDSILPYDSERLSFIKCDVEGHELSCLKGAFKTIRTCQPAWLMEVWGNPDDEQSQANQTFQLMESEGYFPFVFDGKRLKRRGPGDISTNYFFLTKRHTQELEKQQHHSIDFEWNNNEEKGRM